MTEMNANFSPMCHGLLIPLHKILVPCISFPPNFIFYVISFPPRKGNPAVESTRELSMAEQFREECELLDQAPLEDDDDT